MRKDISAKQELLKAQTDLLWAKDAGKLDSLDCPSCRRQTVSVWFTHPRADTYREWYVCASCSFSLRMQIGGIPKHYSESRIDQTLQQYDIDLLAKCKLMELDAIAFPALIIADDGWVEYAKSAMPLSIWTTAAVSKYSKRRLLVYDCLDRVWLADSIAPRQPRNAFLRLSDRIRNPRIAIRILLRQVTDDAADTVRRALLSAIDADDDLLTQNVGGAELKQRIQDASSFKAIVHVLRSARAIDT